MQRTIAWIGILIFWLSNLSANSDAQERYQTENVVIAIMDGTSWDVSYGDPEHRFVSRLWNELRPQGTLYTNFYNDDVTITKAGHSTITTGTWQKMRNRGPRLANPAHHVPPSSELRVDLHRDQLCIVSPSFEGLIPSGPVP